MSQEPRKATDVLVELEAKINALSGTIQSMDLNIKILSNKLSEVMKSLDKQQAEPPRILVEAIQTPSVATAPQAVFGKMPGIDPERSIVVKAESKLPEMEVPGFRRTSRPESFSGDGAYLKRAGVPAPHETPFGPGNKLPKPAASPPPGRSGNDVPATPALTLKNKAASSPQPETQSQAKAMTGMDTHGIVPVEQRVVDRNGKSVFLADVEIVDLSSGEQVSKSRTNGTGKWMAALPLGQYRVTIRKLESITREKVEAIQTIDVDGTESPLKLQMVIIK
jgi:hypothetical protein